MRPKGVADGIPVNIPDLPRVRYHDGATQKDSSGHIWLCGSTCVSWFQQVNPLGLNSEAQSSPVLGQRE